MQTDTIVQLFTPFIQKEIAKISNNLSKTWDLSQFEDDMTKLMNQLQACLTKYILEYYLTDPAVLMLLKVLGGKLGMKFKEYRTLCIRLSCGLQITITTPYFLKTKAKRGRKKRGPNGRGKHLGLEVFGILGRATPAFLSKSIQMAVLCPSYEVAKAVFREQGVQIDVKTLRGYCNLAGIEGLKWRGLISLDGTEKLEGVTVVIGIDGGRLRTRRRKPGRWKNGQKRQGFYAEWKEPKLFTIYFLDAKGEVIRELAPLHDATMGDHEAAFALLEQYLSALPLEQAEKLVFCGDGASWIWSGAVDLCKRMQLDMNKVHQVLDYTHAKQQLGNLLNYVSKGNRKKGKLDRKWKKLLWNGQIDKLKTEVEKQCVGTRQEAALKKWKNYFKKNELRMQYQTFEDQYLPRGSGHVESAIRRVINLRLKAPGTFWKTEMAEAFLFLRSQFISGRWSTVMRNITRQMARMFHRKSTDKLNTEQFQPRLNHTEVADLG